MPAADQIDSREGDRRSRTADAAHRILAEQFDTAPSGVSGRASSSADTAAMVQSQDLPDLRIGDDSQSAPHESDFMHFVHGAEAVVSDLARGVVDEVVHHPGEVVGSALTGLAIGTAAVLAAPLAPVAVGLATVAGGAYGLYQLATHAGGWAHSADVVSNSQDYTKKEVVAAHQDLQGVGRGSVLVGAGIGGSFGAGAMAGLVRSGFSGTAGAIDTTVVEVLPRLEGPTTLALEGPQGVPLLEGPPRVPLLEGPPGLPFEGPTAGAPGGTAVGVTSEAVAAGSASESAAESAVEAASIRAERVARYPEEFTAEEIAVWEESTDRNRAIFQAARERGEVVPSKLAPYPWIFGPNGGRIRNPAAAPYDGEWAPDRMDMVRLTDPMNMMQPGEGLIRAEAGDWLGIYDFYTGKPPNHFELIRANDYARGWRAFTPEELSRE